ncbi:MAG: GNAT family N-acetyltransferase [Bacteroidales bacterium]|jgi:GNAT superfamily N-acetyltransferase|nr:GNAT family N-acetyltransferase [Bacteroidales bacterium]
MITYRELTKSDLPSALKLYTQLHPEEETISITKAEHIWDIAANQHIKYFAAVDNDNVIAVCFICIIPNLTRHGKSIGFIENVVTDKNYRRLGIGKTVIELATAYAKANNCYKVLLQSTNTRKDAHQFYFSIGFDGETKKAFEKRIN